MSRTSLLLAAALAAPASADLKTELKNYYDRVDPPLKNVRPHEAATIVRGGCTSIYWVLFAATNEPTYPTTWVSNGVSVYHGHTPFQRAPNLIQPPLLTNTAATQQTLRLNLRSP